MKIAVYPGSFDPITCGHLDIIERASQMFDKIIVAVLINDSKKPLFTIQERMDMIKKTVEKFDNVSVDSFEGLLVKYLEEKNANIIVRGLRALSDFETEFQMALTNRKLSKDIDTVFLMTKLEYSYLSSSIAKEIAKFGGELIDLVPQYVNDKLIEKIGVK